MQRKEDVAGHGERGKQRIGLKDHADPTGFDGQAGNVVLVEMNRAFKVGRFEASD